MDSDELYTQLKNYFPNNLDLMKYLSIKACWEYYITENSTEEENSKLHYFLYKKDESTLIMTKKDPNIKPDLILYFTEGAISRLIKGNPSADEYYSRYREVMDNPRHEIEVDSFINKPRLKLWKIGYKKWQKTFKF